MAWESAGYGVFPILGNKAPSVNAAHEFGKTVIRVDMPSKLDDKQLREFTDIIFNEGKKILAAEKPLDNG